MMRRSKTIKQTHISIQHLQGGELGPHIEHILVDGGLSLAEHAEELSRRLLLLLLHGAETLGFRALRTSAFAVWFLNQGK